MEEDKGQILLYQPQAERRIKVMLQGEAVWICLDQIAELFLRN